MKQIFLIITIVFFAFQLKAQLVCDEWGEIVPFSLTEKYKAEIEAYKISGFIIPYMDNDSLSNKYNNGKSIDELGDDFTGGIDLLHEPISLKKNGVCIKLKHGKLWRYAIEGVSAGGIGFDFGFPKLPKGTYIAIFAADTTVNLIQQTKVYHSENLLERHKRRGLRGSVFGKKMIIEYYEPKKLKGKEDIFIKKIGYDFVGFGNQKSSLNTEPEIKSGRWGDSDYSQCQKDVECTEDIGNYLNEAKSVVCLYIKYEIDEDDDGNFERKIKKGTGFFLNKAGGYNSNDSPLLVTAGHLYSYFKLDLTPIDIEFGITDFKVLTKYQNLECGTDNTENGGIELPGYFNRIALGSSYADGGLPWYSANHDYAILQAVSSVGKFSNYDLQYGAWSNSHDFYSTSNVGYFCIHHPQGDVKKINKDNDYASSVSFDGFKLKYDFGLTEGGSSGAPVFNSSRQIVGFHVAGDPNKDCSLIGQMISSNGTLDNLYYEFSSTLDPNGVGQASSSNPSPPSPSELPSHCRNCTQDQDEIGLDCGGSCFPCGMQDVVALKTLMDIPSTVKSRYEIFAEPDPNTLLALKGGDYRFEAGLNVHLKSGFEVEQGATFYAGIDAELMTEADRGCQEACINFETTFEPDGDGINDNLSIRQAFVTKYDIKVFSNRWQSELIYSKSNVPIFNNGYVEVWDGTGAEYLSNWVVFTYYDCFGNPHEYQYSVGAFGLKSASIIGEQTSATTDIKQNDAINKIMVYPNPFTENITINSPNIGFPLEYKITDLNGKVITNGKSNSNSVEVDLGEVATGTYILNAKAGEYNLIQKLIKQ